MYINIHVYLLEFGATFSVIHDSEVFVVIMEISQ